MPNKNIRWLLDLMYELEQDYGEPITYTVMVKSEQDIVHGTTTVTKLTYRIKKAIRLSALIDRQQNIRGISFRTANRNFDYGATFDTDTVVFLISKKRIPPGVKLDLNNFIFAKHERFTIQKAELLEHGAGWLVTVQHHKGSLPFEPIQLSIVDTLQYQQEIINA